MHLGFLKMLEMHHQDEARERLVSVDTRGFAMGECLLFYGDHRTKHIVTKDFKEAEKTNLFTKCHMRYRLNS